MICRHRLRAITRVAASAALVLTSLSGCSSPDEATQAQAPATQSPETLPLEVQTAEGPVRGTADATLGARTFLGIPYVAPPTGVRRWKRPMPVTPWSETRDATAFSKVCPQPHWLGLTSETDEDCLTLNVFTSATITRGAKPMPVMVWIHPGGFTTGSSIDFIDGGALSVATGAMIVTFNYRLGVLGFLAHPTVGANFGLWDQKAALEWVQRNASAFGGDPRNVTLFGQSAGAQSVGFLATAPGMVAQGLFHRAILESGIPGNFVLPDLTQGTKEAADLARAVGCATGEFDCLRAKPADALVGALKYAAGAQPVGGFSQGSAEFKFWFPTVDGMMVSPSPTSAFQDGTAAQVPYLIGTMKAEGATFHHGLLFGDKPLTSGDQYLPALQAWLGDANGTKVAQRYPLSAFGGDPNQAFARIDTLSSFVCPARAMARAVRDAGLATYVYSFARAPEGGLGGLVGAGHAMDLIFLFDMNSPIYGAAGDDARGLVEAMRGYWGSFARTGAPSYESAPGWPAFGGTEKHLVLDVPITTGDSLEKAECDFWDTLPRVTIPPMYTP
jgi:para-nitrobenzyl esterase